VSNTPDPVVHHYVPRQDTATAPKPETPTVNEIGGRRDGTEPTRYGDWEKQGRCIDF
jgi:hypothetical protein